MLVRTRLIFFYKQKTAYEIYQCDWSSDVCSSDLEELRMITLTKEDGPADLDGVTHLSIGVSWDPTAGASGGGLGNLRRKSGTDLDLIAIAIRDGDPVRLAGLDSLDPIGNGSLLHSGDNQTGHGNGDDETVTVEFAKIPPHITSIVFVAAAYKKGS